MLLSCVALAAASCRSVGPNTIPRDQYDYGAAIANAGKEQLLANIVGIRYLDYPGFMTVSSVINQYTLEGEVNIGGGLNTSLTGGDTFNLGGAGRWSDRPAITYTPVSGQKFARSLLTPLSAESLFALVQSGWPADILFQLTVRSVNGIENEWAGPSARRQADPRFRELLSAWGRLVNARAIGMRRDGTEDGSQIIVYRREASPDEQTRKDLTFLFEVLDLDPALDEFPLRYGLIPDDRNEINVITSSLLEMINDLAWRIDVPDEHVNAGRTGSTFVDESPNASTPIRVHHSRKRPENAFVTIQNRDYWFYIDDADMASKRTFLIVQIMLSLTDEGEGARGPIVSLSN